MMEVRIVRMMMDDPLVPVPVDMWFADRIVRPMLVLMMLIMAVGMGMLQDFMDMRVLVPLSGMQPHARRHQRAGDDQG